MKNNQTSDTKPTQEEWAKFSKVTSDNLYDFDPVWVKRMERFIHRDVMEQVKKNEEETKEFFRTHPNYQN